jgi:hypothetical protein
LFLSPCESSQTALPKNFESFPWPEKLPLISIEPLLEEAERKPTMKDWVHLGRSGWIPFVMAKRDGAWSWLS